ncbi:hypothetical protein IF1G_06091 [Cordyceps javanica]|uniref:Uncharacterized protein n=1 Tax=Cordyceps javanica TaxID=43265 RepID=A0A545V055_9HYPO|nr:hypothetical protein IF1G_06091 [Cordyceps javanica]
MFHRQSLSGCSPISCQAHAREWIRHTHTHTHTYIRTEYKFAATLLTHPCCMTASSCPENEHVQLWQPTLLPSRENGRGSTGTEYYYQYFFGYS